HGGGGPAPRLQVSTPFAQGKGVPSLRGGGVPGAFRQGQASLEDREVRGVPRTVSLAAYGRRLVQIRVGAGPISTQYGDPTAHGQDMREPRGVPNRFGPRQ